MEKTLERLRETAKKHHPQDVKEGRRIGFNVCQLCGTSDWRSSSAPGDGFDVEIVESSMCGLCEEVRVRSPEVFGWVMRVLGFRDEKGDSGS